jgi:plastocyanin
MGTLMKSWLLFGVLITVAGCAGAPVQEKAMDILAPGEAMIDLHAKSYAFSPIRLIVPAETPLVLRVLNEATLIPHSFILEKKGAGIIVRKQLQKGGETFIRIPPLSAGIYDFYCDKSFMGISHRKMGMEGIIEATTGK